MVEVPALDLNSTAIRDVSGVLILASVLQFPKLLVGDNTAGALLFKLPCASPYFAASS